MSTRTREPLRDWHDSHLGYSNVPSPCHEMPEDYDLVLEHRRRRPSTAAPTPGIQQKSVSYPGIYLINPNTLIHRRSPKLYSSHTEETHQGLDQVAKWVTERLARVQRLAENRTNLRRAETSAYALLDYGDSWDGEGASAITEETVKRAVDVLRSLVKHAEANILILPLPKFNPNQDGSVDLYWETDKVTLFLNVPSRSTDSIGFFGKGKQEHSNPGKYAGEFRTGAIRPDLVAWLTQ